MKKTIRIAAALIAGTAALALGSTAVAEAHTHAPGPAGFGKKVIREGIPISATRFTVSSPDVRNGGSFAPTDFANGFGCTGDNRQPRLSWSGAPAGTQSYAVTMYDPDAPTGSGFWHLLEWDIPASASTLDSTPPAGTVVGVDDAGIAGYLGPCPPVGDIIHRYQITVYALDVPTLGLPSATSPAITGFTMSSHILGYAQMTVSAQR